MTTSIKPSPEKTVTKCAAIAAVVCCALLLAGFGYAGQNETRAKQLQLEATKLQLKGDLENALIKYRESQELVPNPRLEKIVQRLEKRMNKTQAPAAPLPEPPEETAAVQPTEELSPPASTTVPAAKAVSTETVEPIHAKAAEMVTAEEPEAVKTVEALETPGSQQEQTTDTVSSVKKYVPKDPQEQRICNYIDKQLSYFPKKKDGSSIVQSQYTIEKTATDYYKVLFDIFVISWDKTTLDMAPIQLDIIPQEGTLGLVAQLPRTFVVKDDKEKIELAFSEQFITAVWNEKLEDYKAMDAAFSDVSIKEKGSDTAITIGSTKIYNKIKETPENNWSNGFSFALGDITIKGKDESTAQLHIDSLSGANEFKGKNISLYLEQLHKNSDFLNTLFVTEQPQKVTRQEESLAALDTVMELWSETTGDIALHGISLTGDNMRFNLDSIEGESSTQKKPADKKIASKATLTIKGIRINEENTETQSAIERLNLENLTFSTTGKLNAIPTGLFAKTGKLINDIIQAEDKQQYVTQGKEQLSEFLTLFASCGVNAELHNITVIPDEPDNKVHLDTMTIKNSFDATPESGGLISLFYSLSGLKADTEPEFTVPEAARLSMELHNIPSLVKFIENTIDQTPVESIEEKLPDLLLQNVMSSNLTLKIADTFIAFPQSRLHIDGTSKLAPDSPFFSVNSFQAVITNPEDFQKNTEAIRASIPEISRAMGTYTALANRTTTEDGITTDTLAIETTPEGKIFSNGKDVTSMLLKEQ
ncbi:MAG: hypothetical protein CSA26_02405 [Desulfobacterales bacterium]|nr:MAG: hypothetical protein CSA26_02405 [Desulfobacterales bacterium]